MNDDEVDQIGKYEEFISEQAKKSDLYTRPDDIRLMKSYIVKTCKEEAESMSKEDFVKKTSTIGPNN